MGDLKEHFITKKKHIICLDIREGRGKIKQETWTHNNNYTECPLSTFGDVAPFPGIYYRCKHNLSKYKYLPEERFLSSEDLNSGGGVFGQVSETPCVRYQPRTYL
jgi:hypothetical protein